MWWLVACQKAEDFSSTPYEPDAVVWYEDADGDGYGNPNGAYTITARPDGYVDNDLDCDDQDVDVHPEATETCGGGDEDCDGFIDDADPDLNPDRTFWADPDEDGLGDPQASRKACAMPDGYVDNDEDCSPEPLAVDWVDGVDDDCDGREDVQGDELGTWWYAYAPLERQMRVGDTTLLLMDGQLYVLRDEDIDLDAELLLFDETLALGELGDVALAGEHVWVRSGNALYRIDPTQRGLSPLEEQALQSVSLFQGFPFAVGDYDGNGLIEVATNMPQLSSFELGTDDYDTLGEPAQVSSLEAWDLRTVHFSGDSAEDLLVDFQGLWLLSPGSWSAPHPLYTTSTEHAVGDLDGDGQEDLAVCTGARVEVWLGARFVTSPTEWTTPDLVTQGPCVDVAVGDVTGDGLDDLWISEASRAVLAAGSQALPEVLVEQDWLLLLGQPSIAVEAIDLDGDGRAELGSLTPSGWQWLSGAH
jgi:hypothetical protein